MSQLNIKMAEKARSIIWDRNSKTEDYEESIYSAPLYFKLNFMFYLNHAVPDGTRMAALWG